MISHIESEEILIAAMLSDYHEALAKADGLSVDKFTKKIHRDLFAAMLTRSHYQVRYQQHLMKYS
jgi:replicative DNA helicase